MFTFAASLKSHWCAIKPDDIPYMHNLMKLVQSTGPATKMSDTQLKLLADLMPLNIECRYPSYKDELAKKLTKEFCKELINRTKELKSWIESKH